VPFEIRPNPARAPHRPTVRAGVVRGFNCYSVPGVADVEAWPYRPLANARAIARRLYRERAAYTLAVIQLDVPGVALHVSRRGRKAA